MVVLCVVVVVEDVFVVMFVFDGEEFFCYFVDCCVLVDGFVVVIGVLVYWCV